MNEKLRIYAQSLNCLSEITTFLSKRKSKH